MKPATQVRNITVKTFLSADEFLAFENKCISTDISQSKALRDLANGWTRSCKNTRTHDRRNRPNMGHIRHMQLPSYRAPSNFRLRQ